MARFFSTEISLTRTVTAMATVIAIAFLGIVLSSLHRPASHRLVYGMSRQQVREIMGEPEVVLGFDKLLTWHFHEGRQLITVDFDLAGDRLEFVSGGKGHPFEHPLAEIN